MIPCYICGRDIGGGWSIGFPPAPDSQKMGLCREHDAPLKREQVQKAWQELIYQDLAENNRNTAFKAGGIPQLLSIYFTGGGAISIPCLSFSIMSSAPGGMTGSTTGGAPGGAAEGNTLKIITPGGESIYFPLGQVRNYALSPLPHAEEAPRRARAEQPPLKGALPPDAGANATPEQEPKEETRPQTEPEEPEIENGGE